MKAAVFWNVAPCSWQKLTDVSEDLTASIIRAMSDDSDDDGGNKHL
jgi:hypothetical protein